MGNCCRVFINLPISQVKEVAGNHPAVLNWGKDAIVEPVNSKFGRVHPECKDHTEINCINSPHLVARLFQGVVAEVILQDLDGYGIDKWFRLSIE